MSLSVSHHVVCEIRADQVDLRREVCHFVLVFRLTGRAVVAQGDVWIDLWGARLTIAGDNGHQQSFGIARADIPVRVRRTGMAISAEFRRELQWPELQAIEDVRDGGNLSFNLSVFGDGGDQAGHSERISVQQSLSITVPRSDWIAKINAVQAQNIALFEIPFPILQPASEWRELSETLAKAQSLFLEGHYSESVLNCRKCFEVIGRALGWPENWAPQALDRVAKDRRSMTPIEREQLLFASVHHFANLSAHSTERYGRGQARLALSETIGAIALLTIAQRSP